MLDCAGRMVAAWRAFVRVGLLSLVIGTPRVSLPAAGLYSAVSLPGTGLRRDDFETWREGATRWGTNRDVITVNPGDVVARGQILGKAASTGPGGCGCRSGGADPNHHRHTFFAHRDSTECYPTRHDAEGASAGTAWARYPSVWLGGRPQLPTALESFKGCAPDRTERARIQCDTYSSCAPR